LLWATLSQPFLVGLARWQEILDHALEHLLLAIESGVQQFGLEIQNGVYNVVPPIS
jgi:hypothetical protein